MNKTDICSQFENPGHMLSWAKNFDRPELVKELEGLLANVDWQSRPGPVVMGVRAWDETYGVSGEANWPRVLEICSVLEQS